MYVLEFRVSFSFSLLKDLGTEYLWLGGGGEMLFRFAYVPHAFSAIYKNNIVLDFLFFFWGGGSQAQSPVQL